MTKHTPGPWMIGERVKTARLDNALMIRPADHCNYEYGATAIIGTSEANARLIAAAPDLLDALQSMVDAYQTHFDVMPVAWQTCDNIARAAIAKATGE